MAPVMFVAVEAKGERRVIEITERRTKPEFVTFVRRLVERTYAPARKVQLVLAKRMLLDVQKVTRARIDQLL